MRARTRWLYHTLSLRWYRPKSSGFRAIDFRIESGTSYSVYGRGIESDFNLFRSIYPLGFWVRLVSSGVGDQTNTITCNVIFWWFSFGVDLPADDCSSATVFINWKQTSDTHGFVFDLLHFICNSYMWFYLFFFFAKLAEKFYSISMILKYYIVKIDSIFSTFSYTWISL